MVQSANSSAHSSAHSAALSPYRERLGLGIVLIILSTVFTSSQEAAIKFASSDMTLSQLFVLRSAFLIPILLGIGLIWGGGAGTFAAALRPWPLARALMFVGMYLTTYSVLPFLPLAAVAGGLYTAPLFVAALSPLLLGEPVRWWSALAIITGFCGVLLILQPGTDTFTWGLLVPVIGGLFYALSSIITRSKCRHEEPAALAVSLAVTLLIAGLITSAAIALWQPDGAIVSVSPFLFGQWAPLGKTEWIVIGILTALMVGNGLVLPAAYQAAPTVIIATFDYCYLIFATLFGFVLFAEVPTMPTLLGMALIAGAGLLIAWKAQMQQAT